MRDQDKKTSEYRRLLDKFTLSVFFFLVAVIVVLVFWGSFYFHSYSGIRTIDTFDLAQEARHLFKGEGFTTSFIRPVTLLYQESNVNQPDTYNSPAYVWLLSLFYRAFGVGDNTVLGSSLAWSFLSALLLAYLAYRLLNFPLALAVFIIYTTNPAVMESAFSGLQVTYLSFLILSLTAAVYFRKSSSPGQAILPGVIGGLLVLSEFDFRFLVLFMGLFVVFDSRSRRWRSLLYFAAGLLIIVLPWMIRNAAVTGHPLASLRWQDFKLYSLLSPGNKIFRAYDSGMIKSSLSGAAFVSKFMMFTRLMHPFWLSLSHSLLLPFFLVSIFLKSGNPRWRKVNLLIYIMFFAELVLIAAGNGDMSRLLLFMPLIILGGLVAVVAMLKEFSNLSRRAYSLVIAVFLFANIYPSIASMVWGMSRRQYIPAVFTPAEAKQVKNSRSLEKIQNLVKKDEVAVSDSPWAVAWYANRNAVWIPWEVDQMKKIKRKFKNIRFLYLTPALFNYPPVENVKDWQSIYRSGMVPEWLQVDRGLLLPGNDLIMGDILFERLDLE
jgi:4-amino-4-deoxy-L-arabinose transferase-like glycosyltransferase